MTPANKRQPPLPRNPAAISEPAQSTTPPNTMPLLQMACGAHIWTVTEAPPGVLTISMTGPKSGRAAFNRATVLRHRLSKFLEANAPALVGRSTVFIQFHRVIP